MHSARMRFTFGDIGSERCRWLTRCHSLRGSQVSGPTPDRSSLDMRSAIFTTVRQMQTDLDVVTVGLVARHI